MCGAQNNPGMPACYNCGSALAQTFAQPQQQWAPQQPVMQAAPAAPAQQQWAPQQPVMQAAPAAPAQQQWAPQQPAMPAAPAAGGGYGGGTASSWDQGFSYSSHGHGGGSNVVKIATISIVSLILVGGGTLTTLWAMGVIWSDADIVGEWTTNDGDVLEFKEDGTINSEEDMPAGYELKWEVDGDELTWTMSQDSNSQGTPMFECDNGERIDMSWVNDDEDDCSNGEDEGASQTFIDSRTVYVDGGGDMFGNMDLIYKMKFEIVGDVMFLKMLSITVDGEDVTDDFMEGNAECAAFVRGELDDKNEWEDAIDAVEIPDMCDGEVEGYDGGDSGPARYSFDLYDAYGSVSDADDDDLVQITMSGGEDMSWSVIEIKISVNGNTMFTCANPGQSSSSYYCSAYGESTGQDWSVGETILIKESGGFDHCSSSCEIEVRITNRMDGVVLYSGYAYIS
jgi:hypothetical protein